jgi:hypothetical protein
MLALLTSATELYSCAYSRIGDAFLNVEDLALSLLEGLLGEWNDSWYAMSRTITESPQQRDAVAQLLLVLSVSTYFAYIAEPLQVQFADSEPISVICVICRNALLLEQLPEVNGS